MNSVEVTHHFATPFWRSKLKYDNTLLSDYILSLEVDGGVVKSNRGGYQSAPLDMTTPEIKDFLNAAAPALTSILDSLQAQTDKDFKVLNLWVNVNRRGHYNSTHAHPKTLLSAVYYVRTPNSCGNIRFYRNDGMLQTTDLNFSNEVFAAGIEFSPEEGELIVFPAWLPHEVLQSNSDEPRISLAFNLG
jgi:uncharacterized protein (TIGR02466 family)